VDIISLAGRLKTDIHLADEEIQQAIIQGYVESGISGIH